MSISVEAGFSRGWSRFEDTEGCVNRDHHDSKVYREVSPRRSLTKYHMYVPDASMATARKNPFT